MKRTTKTNPKLNLRKQTVRTLSSKALSNVAGGALRLNFKAIDDDGDTTYWTTGMSSYHDFG